MPPPCKHDPPRLPPPGESYSSAYCAFCWHYQHTASCNRRWGGQGVRAGRCLHLGGDTGERVLCPSCRGKVELKTFTCAVHGRCTQAKKVEGVACCTAPGLCPDWTAEDPFSGAPVRDLAYHVYPVRGNGVWQWNVRQLLRRIDLFNGRRAVGIAVDGRTDNPREVMAAFRGEVDDHDFVVVRNKPELREVATFEPLFERMQTREANRCLLYAHAKAVIRGFGSPSHRWAEALSETCLDHWPLVEEQLVRHRLTGPFRWRNRAWPEQSRATWFYSGSWVWYRSRHLFARNWREINRFIFGIEPYPALHFSHDESGCLFGDEPGDLYQDETWQKRFNRDLLGWQKTRIQSRHALPEDRR
jgi:hypothetical protein